MFPCQDKNTIRNEGSTALYNAYTVFTLDTVDAVDMVYTVDMVHTVDMVYTAQCVLCSVYCYSQRNKFRLIQKFVFWYPIYIIACLNVRNRHFF